MRISDWSSDVCSSDLLGSETVFEPQRQRLHGQVDIGASDLGAGLEPVIAQAESEVGREVVSGADPDVGIDRAVAFLDDAGDTGNLDVELAGDDAGAAAHVEAHAYVDTVLLSHPPRAQPPH